MTNILIRNLACFKSHGKRIFYLSKQTTAMQNQNKYWHFDIEVLVHERPMLDKYFLIIDNENSAFFAG